MHPIRPSIQSKQTTQSKMSVASPQVMAAAGASSGMGKYYASKITELTSVRPYMAYISNAHVHFYNF